MDPMLCPPPAEAPAEKPAKARHSKTDQKAAARAVAKMGRPSDYSQEIAQLICEKVSEGMTIRKICKLPGFPSKVTFFAWRHQHEDFARAYALAKQCYAEDIFDENIEIADNVAKEIAKSKDDDGTKAAKVRAAKLRIDTRFTTSSRLSPHKYGLRAIEPLLPQVLPTRDDDDDNDEETAANAAKVVEGTNVARHPLYEQMMAVQKAAKAARSE